MRASIFDYFLNNE